MRPLTLNIDDSLATRFDGLPKLEKDRVAKLLGNVLEEIFKRDQNKALFDSLDELAEEAKKSGLTIAKLAELMNWDETTTRNLFGEEAVMNGH